MTHKGVRNLTQALPSTGGVGYFMVTNFQYVMTSVISLANFHILENQRSVIYSDPAVLRKVCLSGTK